VSTLLVSKNAPVLSSLDLTAFKARPLLHHCPPPPPTPIKKEDKTNIFQAVARPTGHTSSVSKSPASVVRRVRLDRRYRLNWDKVDIDGFPICESPLPRRQALEAPISQDQPLPVLDYLGTFPSSPQSHVSSARACLLMRASSSPYVFG
jgi:hypothetical protein